MISNSSHTDGLSKPIKWLVPLITNTSNDCKDSSCLLSTATLTPGKPPATKRILKLSAQRQYQIWQGWQTQHLFLFKKQSVASPTLSTTKTLNHVYQQTYWRLIQTHLLAKRILHHKRINKDGNNLPPNGSITYPVRLVDYAHFTHKQ